MLSVYTKEDQADHQERQGRELDEIREDGRRNEGVDDRLTGYEELFPGTIFCCSRPLAIDRGCSAAQSTHLAKPLGLFGSV